MASGSPPLFSFADASDPRDGRRPGELAPLAAGRAVPAHAFGSGLLDQMGGVGPRVIPLPIALPIKDAIARGDIVVCWINGQPILVGYLDFDHIIPWSYGGATNAANLLPAGMSANRSRGNNLDLLYERKIGWKWDLDQQGRRVRVPDTSQRLVRVVTQEGEAVYFSVPKFNAGQLATGAAGSAGLALAIEGAMQWRRGEFRPDDLGEQAAKAAAGYGAGYTAKIGVKALAPKAMTLVGPGGVQLLSKMAGPVAFVATIYAAEAIKQGVALARGEVTAGKAATRFVLAPVGAVKDTADLVVYGYKSVSPKHRAIRASQQKWRSIAFVPDLKRQDPAEVLALAPAADEAATEGHLSPPTHPPDDVPQDVMFEVIDPSTAELVTLEVEPATGAGPGWAAA
ncbi:MAG: HNH endonuclease signature motif containing protein [Acidimicrobiales bacterium]|nr:HNH endonuclease signature motif containing protein [Acidimicrobiales bacterium]